MQNDFLKLSIDVDPKLLLEDLNKYLNHQFIDHFNRKDYRGSWTSISLRSPDGRAENIFAYDGASTTFRDTPLLSQCHYFKSLINSLKCEKQSIRLLNLKTDSTINEHTDYMLAYEDGFFRLHVPIITNDRVVFYIHNHKLHMNAGDCWYANFSLPHRVVNNGSCDRIHLVIDCERNEWTDVLFSNSGYDLSAKRDDASIRDRETALKVIAELEKMNSPAALDQASLLRSLHNV